MKKLNGYIKRETISLMCENVRRLVDDIDQLVIENPEKAIKIIHGQYEAAYQVIKKKFLF